MGHTEIIKSLAGLKIKLRFQKEKLKDFVEARNVWNFGPCFSLVSPCGGCKACIGASSDPVPESGHKDCTHSFILKLDLDNHDECQQ